MRGVLDSNPHPLPITRPRRAPWRQRLVDAERGITHGLRDDSTLYFHLFVVCVLLAIGGVLDLAFWEWIIVGLSVTLLVVAELFHQAIRTLVDALQATSPNRCFKQVRHLATAAVAVAFLSGTLMVGLIYWRRLCEMFAQ